MPPIMAPVTAKQDQPYSSGASMRYTFFSPGYHVQVDERLEGGVAVTAEADMPYIVVAEHLYRNVAQGIEEALAVAEHQYAAIAVLPLDAHQSFLATADEGLFLLFRPQGIVVAGYLFEILQCIDKAQMHCHIAALGIAAGFNGLLQVWGRAEQFVVELAPVVARLGECPRLAVAHIAVAMVFLAGARRVRPFQESSVRKFNSLKNLVPPMEYFSSSGSATHSTLFGTR